MMRILLNGKRRKPAVQLPGFHPAQLTLLRHRPGVTPWANNQANQAADKILS